MCSSACLLAAMLTAPAAPLTGARLDAELWSRIDLQWDKRTLEEGLRQLAKEHNFNLVIDARVDRQYEVFGNPRQTPLEQCLDMLARLTGARAVLIGDVVYVGPKETANRAAAAAALNCEKLQDLDEDLEDKLRLRGDIRFKPDQTVREIVERFAKGLDLRLEGAEKLDARLKPDALEKASVADILFVLLAQCDQTFEIDQKNGVLKVVDLPDAPVLEARYRMPVSRARQAARAYAEAIEGLQASARGSRLTVRGPWSAVRAVERLMAEQRTAVASKASPAPKESKEEKYAVVMRNTTLEKFAKKIAEVTGRDVTLDKESLRKAGKSPLDRLSCVVSNVTIEELLETVLAPRGIKYRIEKDHVTLYAEPKASDE